MFIIRFHCLGQEEIKLSKDKLFVCWNILIIFVIVSLALVITAYVLQSQSLLIGSVLTLMIMVFILYHSCFYETFPKIMVQSFFFLLLILKSMRNMLPKSLGKGRILSLLFDGKYTGDSKSSNGETKKYIETLTNGYILLVIICVIVIILCFLFFPPATKLWPLTKIIVFLKLFLMLCLFILAIWALNRISYSKTEVDKQQVDDKAIKEENQKRSSSNQRSLLASRS